MHSLVYTQANKTARQLIYEKNQYLRISHVRDLKTALIILYNDATMASNTDNSNQGVFLIGLSQNDEMSIPVAWQSRKLRRFVLSTLSAKALALVDALYCANFFRDQFFEMSLFSLSIHDYIDNKSLLDSFISIKNVTEKRLRVDKSYIPEKVVEGCADVKIVISTGQLSDRFTKASKTAVDRVFYKLNYCHIDYKTNCGLLH